MTKDELKHVEAALLPFAEDPADSHLDNAVCHRGLGTRLECNRCGKGIAAHEALKLVQAELGELQALAAGYGG